MSEPCEVCGAPIPPARERRHAKTCSSACNAARRRAYHRGNAEQWPLYRAKAKAAAEARAAADPAYAKRRRAKQRAKDAAQYARPEVKERRRRYKAEQRRQEALGRIVEIGAALLDRNGNR